jgi:Icc-related predicted phosphoesterase
MNILVVSCIHNDIENIMEYSDKLSLLNFDVIVCPGDFTDVPPKGFTPVDIGEIILEELCSFNKPVLSVPGSWDKDLIELLDKKDVSIHGKGRVVGGVGFYGFGGAKTPFNLPYEPDEMDIKLGLEAAYNEVKNCMIKVQVTHAPPARTKIDVIASGAHVGSEIVRKFIEENQPAVAISAHIHEARGVDEIGKTKLINSGRFPEGYCGLVSIKNGSVEAKIINLI